LADIIDFYLSSRWINLNKEDHRKIFDGLIPPTLTFLLQISSIKENTFDDERARPWLLEQLTRINNPPMEKMSSGLFPA